MIRSVLFSFACMVTVVAAFAGAPAAVQLMADTRHVSAGDTLYSVVVILKGKPHKRVPNDARFVLTDAALAPQSLPLLLDSMPDGRFDNTGKYQQTLHVRVKALKCLGRSETFSIILAGKTADKVIIIIDPTPMPAVSMTLESDTSYLDPWLQGPVQEFQSIMPTVQLAGIPADDNNFLELSIPAFYTTQLQSAPVVAANNRLIIPKAQFIKKDGCPVSIRVPAIIQLKKLDSLRAEEAFNILRPGDLAHAHTVIIRKAKAPAAPQQPNRPAAKAPDPVRGFHFACQNQSVLFVSLVEDSAGNLQKILVNQFQTKDTLQYYVLNLYDAPVFATWLTSAFTGIGRDCAAYLAGRIANELKEENLARTKKTPVTVPAINADAAATAATTAAVKSKGDTATTGTKKTTEPKARPVRLDGSATTLHPVYALKDSLKIERVDFYVIRDSMPAGGFPASDTLTFTLDKYTLPASASNEDFTIFTETGNSFIVHKSDWKVRENVTHDSSFSAPVHVYFRNVRIDSIRDDRFANIRLEGNATSFHMLQLTETGTYNASNPFWLDLGTNFDLLDGIQPNNLYSGVYGFKKDVGRIHISFRNKKGREEHRKSYSNNLGFTAGVYETQSSSLAFGSDSGYVYRDGRSYLYDSVSPGKKGYPYYRDTGAVKNTITVKSIGIFFSPHLRLTNKPADAEGFHVFLSAYIEMLWQKVRSEFDYSKSGRDTVMYAASLDGIYPMQYKETSKNIDYRSHYFGMGFPIYLKDKTFSLYVNNSIGICNQRFVAVQDSNWVHTGAYKSSPATRAENFTLESLKGFQQPACNWNFFYLFQFRLNEEKYGISFTGEVRGLMLKNAKSIVSLSLSKKLDLGDLYHTIVKPFTPGN